MYRDDITRVKHMLDSTNEALSFIHSKDRKDLDKERMLVLSLVKSIEIVGEAASKVSEEFKSKYQNIPWKDIIAMRNRLIHVYFDIDYNIVWETVKDELPILREELQKTIKSL